MLTIQPVFCRQYFRFPPRLQPLVYKQFFLSYEDALWHVLQIYKIPYGSIILVPSFFCLDVIQNIEAHGAKCVPYPVDMNFQTTSATLVEFIRKYSPSIIIVFHAVGITNKLLTTDIEWLNAIPENTLLIEDCVHRLINPNEIKFLNDKHLIIDSLRKVIPIQGSFLYSKNPLTPLFEQSIKTHIYRIIVIFWWFAMQFFLTAAHLLPMQSVNRIANKLAEFCMLQGYEIIGDNQKPARGFFLMKFLWKYIDFEKIRAIKKQQILQYENNLQIIWKHPDFTHILYDKEDMGKLRAYPMGIQKVNADKFIKFVRIKGVVARYELAKSPWSQLQKVVYLPIGPHLNYRDINFVTNTILQYAAG